MPRTARFAPGGLVYHVLNRAVARLPLFEKTADYEAFEHVLAETQQRHPTRILAYCLMPNHWHFVLWPRAGRRADRLSALADAHAHHALARPPPDGRHGPSLPRPLQVVSRTDQRTPVCGAWLRRAERRAGKIGQLRGTMAMVERGASGDRRRRALKLLSSWPVEMPSDWLRRLNRPQTEAELEAVRTAVRAAAPTEVRAGKRTRRCGWDCNIRSAPAAGRAKQRAKKICVPFYETSA